MGGTRIASLPPRNRLGSTGLIMYCLRTSTSTMQAACRNSWRAFRWEPSSTTARIARRRTRRRSADREAYQKVLATGSTGTSPQTWRRVADLGHPCRRGEHDGNLIQQPLPGGGEQNSYCAESEKRPADETENARSLGTLTTFGKLKILDLGDLTWDKEMQLMCPVNRLGHVDILIVSHHGWYQSSSPALVDAISPVVALMDNGETKGGSNPTLVTLKKDPGLGTVWQLHYLKEGGTEHNTASRVHRQPGRHRPGKLFRADSI